MKKAVIGDLTLLESLIFNDIVSQINVEDFKEKPVIIKGCSDIFIPETAYSLLIQHLQPHVKSLMFGEACSTVPLYKKKNMNNKYILILIVLLGTFNLFGQQSEVATSNWKTEGLFSVI